MVFPRPESIVQIAARPPATGEQGARKGDFSAGGAGWVPPGVARVCQGPSRHPPVPGPPGAVGGSAQSVLWGQRSPDSAPSEVKTGHEFSFVPRKLHPRALRAGCRFLLCFMGSYRSSRKQLPETSRLIS